MHYTGITLIIMLLLAGCSSKEKQPVLQHPIQQIQTPPVVEQTTPPAPPKKPIKLKEVEDTNYNDAYMYPDDTVKKEYATAPKVSPVVTAQNSSTGMTKEECIQMISQEKFDKYTAMFGNEHASIQRCAMLKAIQ